MEKPSVIAGMVYPLRVDLMREYGDRGAEAVSTSESSFSLDPFDTAYVAFVGRMGPNRSPSFIGDPASAVLGCAVSCTMTGVESIAACSFVALSSDAGLRCRTLASGAIHMMSLLGHIPCSTLMTGGSVSLMADSAYGI
jgi:hypothetical protein